MSQRIFSGTPAILSRIALRVAVAGPTGSGKSLSSHLLAHGFSRVDGKPVYLVNTEGPSKGLMYAPRKGEKAFPPKSFNFVEVPFTAPFRSLDYLAAMRYCEESGAGTIIVDQGSFEHEGEGGYLDFHEKETDRMAPPDATQKQRSKYWSAWVKPGAERHAMLMGMDQLTAHIIWCFRAKEKLKIVTGKEPIDMGWQAIAGLEVMSEFPIRFLLPEGADGVPNLNPTMPGEMLFNRVPIHLRSGFFKSGEPINADLGERLAIWAQGKQKDEKREALLEQIAVHIRELHPGQTEVDKQAKLAILIDLGLPASWREVSNLPIETLEAAVGKMTEGA